MDDKEKASEITPLSIPTSDNSLATVINYYLSGKGILSTGREVLQQMVLIAVAGSGAGLYVVPSMAYAQQHGQPYAGDTLLTREIVYAVGSSVPSLFMLYLATDIFLNRRREAAVPKKLKAFLIDTSSDLKRKLKDMGIFIGAAVSAIPLVFVSLAYPIPGSSEPAKITMAVVVGIDNTVLHLLPLELALTYPIYRLPILPIEYLVKACSSKREPLVPPNVEAEKIRNALIAYLGNVQNALYFTFQFTGCEYKWQLYNKIKDIDFSSRDELWNFIVTTFSPDSFPVSKLRSKVHAWVSPILGAWNAAAVLGAFIGYPTATLKQMLLLIVGNKTLTDENVKMFLGSNISFTEEDIGEASALSSLPIYLMTVLMTFFGYTFLIRMYNWVTDWREGQPKLPFAFLLYPKMFTVLMILSLGLSLYAYAPAEQLIHDTFKGPGIEDAKIYFVWLARIIIPPTSAIAMKDSIEVALMKWAIHFGRNDVWRAARVEAGVKQSQSAAMRIKPEVLIQDRQRLEELKIIPRSDVRGSSEDTANNDLPSERRPEKQGWCSFWSSEPEDLDDDEAASRCRCLPSWMTGRRGGF